jgi:hypothetical protein
MSYIVRGLEPEPFKDLVGLTDEQLAAQNIRRVVASSKPGFPCRVTLEDAEPGEGLLLLNYVSNDAPTPYRTAYAIYVRERAEIRSEYVDELPPALRGRPLSLRAFDRNGMLHDATLGADEEADAKIRELLGRDEIASVHAHNAAYGCFAAKFERN